MPSAVLDRSKYPDSIYRLLYFRRRIAITKSRQVRYKSIVIYRGIKERIIAREYDFIRRITSKHKIRLDESEAFAEGLAACNGILDRYKGEGELRAFMAVSLRYHLINANKKDVLIKCSDKERQCGNSPIFEYLDEPNPWTEQERQIADESSALPDEVCEAREFISRAMSNMDKPDLIIIDMSFGLSGKVYDDCDIAARLQWSTNRVKARRGYVLKELRGLADRGAGVA